MKIMMLLALTVGALFGAQPYNSNVLIQRGIDPQILNNTVTTARQNVAYRMAIKHIKNIGSDQSTSSYFLIFDPYASYGVDMRIQIPKTEIENIDKGDIRNGLDELMAVQLYLQHGNLYDENSIRILSETNNTTVITFDYNEDAMPREMKYFTNLSGSAYVVNGALEKIVVTNKNRFDMRGVEVDSLEKVVYFTKVALNGGYLVNRATLEIHGTKEGAPYVEKISSHMVQYWDNTKQTIPYKGGFSKRLSTQDDEKYETIFVELDRTFPLLGKSARKAGFDLPKAFGVSLVTMLQETTLHMTDFTVNGSQVGEGILDSDLFGKDSSYTSTALAGLVRADMWLLPFVNVGLILGGVSSNTDVLLDIDTSVTLPPALGGGTIPIQGRTALDPITTESVIYGVGTTVAGGVGNFFATVDLQYMTAYTKSADVSLSMMIMTPIVGYNFEDYGTRLLLGGQYQDMKEEITAIIDIDQDGIDDDVVVGLRSEKWAGLIGVEKGFSRHWNGSVMYSEGTDRKSFNMMLGYRF